MAAVQSPQQLPGWPCCVQHPVWLWCLCAWHSSPMCSTIQEIEEQQTSALQSRRLKSKLGYDVMHTSTTVTLQVSADSRDSHCAGNRSNRRPAQGPDPDTYLLKALSPRLRLYLAECCQVTCSCSQHTKRVPVQGCVDHACTSLAIHVHRYRLN